MKMKTLHGFMMIELLIALLIMAIMAFVCMGYYTKTLIIQQDTALYLQAMTVLSSALEKVISEKKLPTSAQETEGVFVISWQAEPLTSTHGLYTSINKEFIIIEATVSWQSLMKIPRKIIIRSGFVPRVGVLT